MSFGRQTERPLHLLLHILTSGMTTREGNLKKTQQPQLPSPSGALRGSCSSHKLTKASSGSATNDHGTELTLISSERQHRVIFLNWQEFHQITTRLTFQTKGSGAGKGWLSHRLHHSGRYPRTQESCQTTKRQWSDSPGQPSLRHPAPPQLGGASEATQVRVPALIFIYSTV